MKISVKFGIWIFVCILVIESFSMMYLHRLVLRSNAMQQLNSLRERGNSHRDVLEISRDQATLHHIALMESKTDTEVVIIDREGTIIESSGNIDTSMESIIKEPLGDVPRNGMILQDDLEDNEYIASISPFESRDGKSGFVYMFRTTEQVQSMISQLNSHFIWASLLILLFMVITVFILSRFLTKPLIKMKEATKKLSNGNFSVSLPAMGNDEIGELSKSIQTLANDLNHLKKERNEFLASISHELRTPLTYIKGYSDIGRRPSLKEEERMHFFEIIHEESENLNQLVKELFELAGLDQNTFTIQKERVQIRPFLQTIYERVLPAFRNKGIKLELYCQDGLFYYFDPKRFEQVLINLLDNALKYSKENTTTKLNAFKKNGSLNIVIEDEGIGIPEEDLPYIFERLYRVEKSRSRATGGFGLGLAIVKELVEAHDGEISVTSKPGEGACFKIVLWEQSA
ncbi:HAMP domain-containing sensor histidine kinase [Bacillus sp. FJAT-27445]|uniref:HAMP domain-containing sensor histidine kinase n=1 Tax=Bacillus sp. FJAT-27445 TaxID=1679166 RepID=UPI000743AA26|nr:HAMP domain-containing sensor histidine kinase [Bacillus sp. FJAT-27445]